MEVKLTDYCTDCDLEGREAHFWGSESMVQAPDTNPVGLW